MAEISLDPSIIPHIMEGGLSIARTRTVDQLDRSAPYDGAWNGLNNCGPACVAMVLYYTHGRMFYPDAIVDEMRGEDHLGYTSVADIVRYLDGHGVPASAAWVDTFDRFRQALRQQVALGHLTIALFYADFAHDQGGHFMVCYGVDDPGADTRWLNPWKGVRLSLGWLEAWENFRSWMVLTHRGYHAGYRVFAERWQARTISARVNLRTGPGRSHKVIDVLPPGTAIHLMQYTDDGEAIEGGYPPTRWHFGTPLIGNRALRGWVADAVLEQQSFISTREGQR